MGSKAFVHKLLFSLALCSNLYSAESRTSARLARMPMYFGKRSLSPGLQIASASVPDSSVFAGGNERNPAAKRTLHRFGWLPQSPIDLAFLLNTFDFSTQVPSRPARRASKVMARMPSFYGKRAKASLPSKGTDDSGIDVVTDNTKRQSATIDRMPIFWGRKRSGSFNIFDGGRRAQLSPEVLALLSFLDELRKTGSYDNLGTVISASTSSEQNAVDPAAATTLSPDVTPSAYSERDEDTRSHGNAPSWNIPGAGSMKRRSSSRINRMPYYFGKREDPKLEEQTKLALLLNQNPNDQTDPSGLFSDLDGSAATLWTELQELLSADDNAKNNWNAEYLSKEPMSKSVTPKTNKERDGGNADDQFSKVLEGNREAGKGYDPDSYLEFAKQILFNNKVSANDLDEYFR
ncbi:uncharacterized protein LOC101858921 [Aplysia californica]|uniref:Uncharacterized protein LOC101858921 n=1 Tax=Aplysia californica TaxID=6500 RepID=A0ABM0JFA2_APLCA|nr:uncharacterized protein LOC101858921 [Aplysia californica]